MVLMTREATVLLAISLLSAPASAGWASLGAMPAPARDGQTLLFRNGQGAVAVSVLSPEVVRVRFGPGGFGRDHSYAVVKRNLGGEPADFDISAERSIITTRALQTTLRHNPFRVAFDTAAGESLDADDPDKGVAFSGKTVHVWKRLRDDEQVYGFGEKTGMLNKRGRSLGGYGYVMWNSDVWNYDNDADPMYASVPFFLVLRNGVSHGIFFDNTFRSRFNVGREEGLLSFGADGGELDYYFIHGPHPKRVIEHYTELTGRMPLPPLWALAYHQCRYSYHPESRVRFIAQNFRERKIPADVLHLDIDYQDEYKPFTWNKERFPDPTKLMADLRSQGFRVVTIVDGHPTKEPGYFVYDSGVAGDHFVKNPDGTPYEAPVWPIHARSKPGPSVFPDFTRPATREWWGNLYEFLLKEGVAGIWNDMNEPATFVNPSETFAPDVRHDNEGKPTDHREVHNVWGMQMARSSYEGQLRLRPDRRPFVLSRASFAGGQRYSALWPGDNRPEWTHLQGSLPMLMNMGISGFPFVGNDIGGFMPGVTAELYARWLQCAAFFPFMRTHANAGPDREPWSFGNRFTEINRRSIELRYELLPYLYNVMREASATGIPAMRPLVLEYPDDPRTYSLDEQFLLGADLMVAPVLRAEAVEVRTYLPGNDWYDFRTGKRHEPGRNFIPVRLDTIPLFVRAGGFIFHQPVIQHTGEMSGQPLKVTAFPPAGTESESSLYEDEGEGFGYQKGVYMIRRFHQKRSEKILTWSVSAPEGSHRPPPRRLIFRTPWSGETRRVSVEGEALARLVVQGGAGGKRAEPPGDPCWFIDEDGFLTVQLQDRWTAFTVAVDG